MLRYKQFGRGIPMPSTAAIQHKLKMMAATDTLTKALRDEHYSSEEISQIIVEMGIQYEMPPKTVNDLRRRFAAG